MRKRVTYLIYVLVSVLVWLFSHPGMLLIRANISLFPIVVCDVRILYCTTVHARGHDLLHGGGRVFLYFPKMYRNTCTETRVQIRVYRYACTDYTCTETRVQITRVQITRVQKRVYRYTCFAF